jgi:hypothetical protein
MTGFLAVSFRVRSVVSFLLFSSFASDFARHGFPDIFRRLDLFFVVPSTFSSSFRCFGDSLRDCLLSCSFCCLFFFFFFQFASAGGTTSLPPVRFSTSRRGFPDFFSVTVCVVPRSVPFLFMFYLQDVLYSSYLVFLNFKSTLKSVR